MFLVEPNAKIYAQLLTRKRRAHSINACISLSPHIETVMFDNAGWHGGVDGNLEGVNNEGLENVNYPPIITYKYSYC